MTETDLLTARTQRHITLVLLYGLLGLIVLLIVASFLPMTMNDKLSGMVSALTDGLLSLTSGAVGYWIARHRPGNETAIPSTTNSANPTPASPATQPGVTK